MRRRGARLPLPVVRPRGPAAACGGPQHAPRRRCRRAGRRRDRWRGACVRRGLAEQPELREQQHSGELQEPQALLSERCSTVCRCGSFSSRSEYRPSGSKGSCGCGPRGDPATPRCIAAGPCGSTCTPVVVVRSNRRDVNHHGGALLCHGNRRGPQRHTHAYPPHPTANSLTHPDEPLRPPRDAPQGRACLAVRSVARPAPRALRPAPRSTSPQHTWRRRGDEREGQSMRLRPRAP